MPVDNNDNHDECLQCVWPPALHLNIMTIGMTTPAADAGLNLDSKVK
jgi:hypothetical protein